MRLIVAAIVFAGALLLYLFTLAPTVTLVDSGELIVASAKLGVAHPPGFPLYLLLTHLLSFVPVGSVAVRVHFASALFGALAAAMMTLLVAELMMTVLAAPTTKKDRKKGKNDDDTTAATPPAALILGPALLAGLLFAFSRTLWAYATIAEVYTLNALMIGTVLWLVFAWRREFLAEQADHKKLYMAALVFGLALGVHHVTVVITLLPMAVLVANTTGRKFFFSKRFLYAALFAIAGLSIYLYLPLAASRGPLINWGEPYTLDAIWRHITGKQYQVYFDFSWARMLDTFRLLGREFGVIWLPAGLLFSLAGSVDMFRKARAMFWFVIAVIVFDVVYCLFYGPAEDKDAYYMPAFIALTIAAGYGLRLCMEMAGKAVKILTPMRAGIVLLAVPVIALASNYAYNDRHRYFVAHDYVENIMASVEPRGMLLTSDWQAYAPSLYTREIEGHRKDVIFIDINLLRRSWYFAYLDQAYPEMMAHSRAQVDAFLQDLRAWDRDPAAYERSPSLNQRINARFQVMLASFIEEHLKTGPLYITMEVADDTAAETAGLIKFLSQKHELELVPQGLVFRLAPKGYPEVLLPPEINIRGLNDGTYKSDFDDVAKRSVVPVYANMLTNTGMYLLSKGDTRGIAYFRKALAIDPSHEKAKQSLAASQAALGK